ncbi:hypothetical protein KAF25_006916 [Fusarium avenaceum]|uniref:Major facilitator superfamily (MFS) profile domain-containing protein n=1 Tax=Fusarium avenaceum TaxID=40199 RepID=A0A9P7GYW0_9HYPO|nr:hypothetical protein KAF25_006916 [Fusarium avenaceum]
MNFYPPPPTIEAEVWLRIPDDKRCIGQNSEWRGGFAGPFKHIFLEGPVVDSVGNLYVVDIPYGRILKIDKDKNVSVACTWDGEPNGLVGTADGDLLVADYKQGILSFNPETGKIGPKLTRKNLERFKGPNDLISDSKGNLYFTDQGQTGMTDPTGRVYRLSPDGRLDTLLDNGPSPNGLVLSRDERFLYVAMTRANQVWRLPLHPDGTTSKAGVFFQSFGNAGPDGLALDEEGNLFICHPSLGSVFVVDMHGIPKARIVSGFANKISNTTLFVTPQRAGGKNVIRDGNIASLVIMDIFKERFGIDNQTDHEYANTKGWIVAIATAGAVFGCLGCVWLTQRLGRTRTFQFFTIVYMIGIFGQTFSNGNLGALYATRVISGIGIGATTVLPSVYIAEISPQPIRGLLTLQYTCCQQLGVVFGFFFNYGVTKYHAGTNLQWQLPTSLQLIPALIWGVGTFFTPETPRFLLSQNKKTEALAVLSRFRGLPEDHPYVQSEFQGIEAQLNHEIEIVAGANTWDLIKETFTDISNRRRFTLMFACHVFGQWSGANAITQYSPTIFGYLGIEGTEARFLATGCYAILKFVSVLIFSIFVIDFIGRRRSLMTGITMQILTLSFVGAYLKVTNGWSVEEIEASSSAMAASRAAIAAIYIHAIAWSIGWFSIPYLVSAEVFPIRIRSINVSVLMAVHWAMYFGCSRAMPSLLAATERYGAFMFFLSICTVSLVYVYFAMPETSGRSLESMDKLFERPWYTVYKIAYPTIDDLKPAAREILEPDMKDQESICDNNRPSCSPCERNGLECLVVISDSDATGHLSRATIDEMEKKEQALSQRLQELDAIAARNASVAETLSPDDRHTVRSIAASSPAAREGASISFIAHLFADANWRKSHASLLRTLADAPSAGEVSIAPCSLPSAAEAQMLFEKYLSWSHVQNPFLLRRSVWALYHRLFSNQNNPLHATNYDLFRAFMICATGSVLPYRNRTHDRHPEAYYNAALQYLGPQFLTRGLESVQDLLLICRFGIYHPIGTSIWDIVRLCGRLCVELGLHSNPNIQGDLLQTQLRRRIFWQFYIIDRYSSTTLDRPFLIDDNDISTKFPVEASDEEIEAANSQIQNLDSYHFSREPGIQNGITVFLVRKIFSSPSKHVLAGHIHVVMSGLLKELQDWRNSTPIIQEPNCLYETQEWITPDDLRASYEGLLRCQELLTSVAKQLPDSKNYVSVFQALYRDVSQRLWPNIREISMNLPADASLPIPADSNQVENPVDGEFPHNSVAGTLSTDMQGFSDFSIEHQFYGPGISNRPDILDPSSQFAATVEAENEITLDFQDGAAVNWALLSYGSLWNMESAVGQYVYGDPTNSGVWDGFEF